MKVYVWFTENVRDYFNLLEKSCEDIDDIELVPYTYKEEIPDKGLEMGEAWKESYRDLMVERWRTLPDIVEENMGKNIVWLDVDCVFNKNNKTFSKTIADNLVDNDFVFQYDTNRGMSEHICTGVMGIKCSEKTLKMVNFWFKDIESKKTKEERRPGFPQTEWNEIFKKHPEFEATFFVLPQEYCSGEGDWGIYHAHAKGTSGKFGSLRDKLLSVGISP